jgi:tight adherence protein B
MVGTEAPEPIASEFRKTFEEINYGIPLPEAMGNLADRVPSVDLRYFVVAVILQRETGGNLAELLGNLGSLIRERFKLIGRIRVLSAEGKMSGYILAGLPFAVALMIFVTNREFLSVLWTDPAGPQLLGGAAVLMLAGILWMRQIVRIKV